MPNPEASSLRDLAGALRERVNRTRRHAKLWRGPRRDWHVVTSALDMLQDTAWSLETYAAEVDGLSDDKPHAYIRIFGVLNGLVIQQDAAFLLFKELGVARALGGCDTPGKWASSMPGLANARRSRIAGAGHPMEWGERRGAPASTFIIQHSVSCGGCQLMILHHDGATESRLVDLKAMIEAQHDALAGACRMAIADLDAVDEEHHSKYRSAPLVANFDACDYWAPKVALAIHGSEERERGLGGLDMVEDALRRFREALAERGRPFEEPLVGLYCRAEYSTRRLRAYFEAGRTGLDIEMAEILAHHIGVVIGQARGIAGEIDQEYSATEP